MVWQKHEHRIPNFSKEAGWILDDETEELELSDQD